jgi:hypothetical protein
MRVDRYPFEAMKIGEKSQLQEGEQHHRLQIRDGARSSSTAELPTKPTEKRIHPEIAPACPQNQSDQKRIMDKRMKKKLGKLLFLQAPHEWLNYFYNGSRLILTCISYQTLCRQVILSCC